MVSVFPTLAPLHQLIGIFVSTMKGMKIMKDH